MGIETYSTTPASNTSINGINIAEGCAPSGINDAIRQMMADVASYNGPATAVAAAATTNLTGATDYIDLSGTTVSVTAVTAPAALVGRRLRVRVTGSAITFTQNAAITMPNAVSVVFATGDVFDLVVTAVNTVRVERIVTAVVVVPDASVTTAKIADTNVTTAKIADGSITPAKLASAGAELGAFRNKVFNGAFDVWLRGTSISSGVAASTYTADRWIALAAGAAVTVSRSVGGGFTAGTDCLLLTGAASNTYVDLRQRFEARDVQKWRNGNVTLSARLYNNTGSTIAANSVTFLVNCPTATDNWAGANQRLGTTFTHAAIPTGTWGLLTITFNPSGYTDIDKGMDIGLRFIGLVAGQAIRWSEIQLEIGSVITPFEQRLAAIEESLCKRYYRLLGRDCWGWLSSASGADLNVRLDPAMRVAPVPTFLTSAWTIFRSIGNSNFPAPLSIFNYAGDTNGLRISFTHGGSGTVGEQWGSIQSDVIALNAEL